MGQWFAKIFNVCGDSKSNDSRILMVGLNTAGKTTILYQLKLNETVATIPTIGFNAEAIKIRGTSLTVFDVGGQETVRPLWRHYYNNNDGLIFVVDSTDHERLREAAEELHHIIDNENMRDVPLLVFANKQDLPTAMSTRRLADGLQLHNFRHNKWYVQASNAVSGRGLREGLEQLSRMVREAKKNRVV